MSARHQVRLEIQFLKGEMFFWKNDLMRFSNQVIYLQSIVARTEQWQFGRHETVIDRHVCNADFWIFSSILRSNLPWAEISRFHPFQTEACFQYQVRKISSFRWRSRNHLFWVAVHLAQIRVWSAQVLGQISQASAQVSALNVLFQSPMCRVYVRIDKKSLKIQSLLQLLYGCGFFYRRPN